MAELSLRRAVRPWRLLRAGRDVVQLAPCARLNVAWQEAGEILAGEAGAGRRPAQPELVARGARGRESRGGRVRRMHDIPAFRAPVPLSWRQRRCRCVGPACGVGGSAKTTSWPCHRQAQLGAAWWAVSCIQRDTPRLVARRLAVDWHTVWKQSSRRSVNTFSQNFAPSPPAWSQIPSPCLQPSTSTPTTRWAALLVTTQSRAH
jgi:hypothetical protein